MTPDLLADYIFDGGIALIVVLLLGYFVAESLGLSDYLDTKVKEDEDDEELHGDDEGL